MKTGEGAAKVNNEVVAPAGDLRTYLAELVARDPEQLLIVEREVDPVFEVTAIVDRLRANPGVSKFPSRAVHEDLRVTSL